MRDIVNCMIISPFFLYFTFRPYAYYNKPGMKLHVCAVVGCGNGVLPAGKWKQQFCSKHQTRFGLGCCDCLNKFRNKLKLKLKTGITNPMLYLLSLCVLKYNLKLVMSDIVCGPVKIYTQSYYSLQYVFSIKLR